MYETELNFLKDFLLNEYKLKILPDYHISKLKNGVKITLIFLGEFYFRNGKFHRGGNAPAVIIRENGYPRKEWWLNGQRHRGNDQPAVKTRNIKEWWIRGKKHRDNDLPAIETPKCKEWWLNGLRHREIGPAYIKYDFVIDKYVLHTAYFHNNDLHRLDGPAVDRTTSVSYFINSNYYDEREFRKLISIVKKFIQILKNAYKTRVKKRFPMYQRNIVDYLF
jgi:hypothetical protein